jgi:hypothetical protein
LNTELGTGDLRIRAAITVSLRVWWLVRDHDGLLICAISADGAVTAVVLMISPSYSHRLFLSSDLLIRRDLQPNQLPGYSPDDLPKLRSSVRIRRQH